jgi:uncharacterized protein (TIGR00290 family)
MADALALSWSGGKDSALALAALRAAGTPPSALLSVVDEASGTVAHHGVGGDLLERQAAAAGAPLVTVAVPAGAPNGVYEVRLRAAFAAPPLDAVGAVAFGDLFLDDLRAYREARMAEAGLQARFPLWGRDTRALAREFVDRGFRAVLVSVDGAQLDPGHLGRDFDHSLLDALPPTVDPCGENGEFHTFVHAAPVFSEALPVAPGARRGDGRFAWLELVLPGE